MKNLILKPRKTRQRILIEDIKAIQKKLEYANLRFQQLTDDDLISGAIYEIQALKAEYSYLLKLAKKENVRADLSPMGAEQTREVGAVG